MAKIPTAESLGAPPAIQPSTGVARYGDPGAALELAGQGLIRKGGQEVQAGGEVREAGGIYQHEGALLGHEANQIFAHFRAEQEKADTTRVEDAWNQYKNAALDVTNGEKGILNLKGGDAVNGNIVQTAQTSLDATREQISGGLANDQQRTRFAQRAAATDLQVRHAAMVHLDTQYREYAKATQAGSEASARSMIAANPTPSDTKDSFFVTQRDSLMLQTDAYLKIQGIDIKTEQGRQAAQAYKEKINDGLWTTRIDSLLYSHPLLADALFRANEKEIKSPEVRLLLQAKTNEVALNVKTTNDAQEIANAVRSRVQPSPAGGGDHQSVPGSVEVGAMPRSSRNNNPGNIEKSAVKWQGEIEGADSRFVTFATQEDGLRAMQQNLLAYQDKHGINTVEGVISRWAPAKENGAQVTDGYIQTVAGALGVASNAKIDLHDPTTMGRVVQAMTAVEAGGSGSMVRVSSPLDKALAPNTNGLPNSRDIAAELPRMLMRVEKRANEIYGTDQGNPDRAVYIKRTTLALHSLVAADVQQLNAIQRQAQGVLIDAVTGVNPSTGPAGPGGIMPIGAGRAGTPGQLITSFSQIQADPKLLQAWQMTEPAAKLGIERLMEHNQRATDTGDNALYRDLWNRIHLEPGDPKKIDFYKQITDPSIADRLSIQQIGQLRLEIDRAETPGGRSITQMRKSADSQVASYFKTNIMFTAQPDRQIAATMRWNEDVGKKVDAYVAAGQPDKVRAMFQLDTPESVVSQKYLQTYIDSTPAAGLAAGAAQVKAGAQGAAPVPQPATIKTREDLDAWFKTLPATVTTFTGADGKTYKVPTRAAAPGAPGATAAAQQMNETGKLVTPQATPPVAEPAEPEMPKLIADKLTPKERMAASRQRGAELEADRNVRMVGGVVRAGQAVGGAAVTAHEAAVAGVVRAAEAVSFPSDAEKSAFIFRGILKTGQYAPSSAPLIREAIDGGSLTVAETKIARRMLKAIK